MKWTLTIVNFNTPLLVYNLLYSFYKFHSKLKYCKLCLIDNSTNDKSEEFFKSNNIPFISRKSFKQITDNPERADHANAVREAMKRIKTKYMILCDSDIEFKRDILDLFDCLDNRKIIIGEEIPDYHKSKDNNKIIAKRIDPAFCIMDLEVIEKYNMYFNSDSRWSEECQKHKPLRLKRENGKRIIYNVGSQLLEDIIKNNFEYVNILIENYLNHFGKYSRQPALAQKKIDEIKRNYEKLKFKNGYFIKP